MGRATARRFLDAGIWLDAAPGTELATEGQPLGALIFLSDGAANVTLNGHRIAASTAGSFIGEMTCLEGGPASATVTLTAPSRYFLIRTDALARLCARDMELRMMLENGLHSDMRKKLIDSNARVRQATAS